MGFNKRPLSASECRRMRSGVNEELAGYVKPEPVTLEDVDYTNLPARGPEDNDLLTASIVRSICEDMAASHVSLAIAGRAVGLPEKLVLSYLDRGNEDLSNGFRTRLSWFAVLINRAEGRVQRSLVGSVIANPLGWLNTAHLLDHLWPESFAVQRMGIKAEKTSQLNEELRKQLDAARDGHVGAPLPYIDVESLDEREVIEVVEE